MKTRKQISIVLVLACLFIAASLASCVSNTSLSPNGAVYDEPPAEDELTDDLDLRQQLMAMGYSDSELDSMIAGGISLERMFNETRFSEYVDRINNNLPIGHSGETILPEYYGGIYFCDEGILTVVVLDEAFNHATSAVAIDEMLELGIMVRTATFTDQELNAAINTLNQMAEDVVKAGATSWGLDTMGNRVTVSLDPYTDEQKAVFMELLFEASIDPAMIDFRQAVIQEMLDARAASIAAALRTSGDQIVLFGEVEISRTGIAFSLENRTDFEFGFRRHFNEKIR